MSKIQQAMTKFLRLVTHFEEVEWSRKDGSKGTSNVPRYTVLDPSQVASWHHVNGDDGYDRTAVVMRNGERYEVAMSEDEFSMYLGLVMGNVTYCTYDRRQYNQRLADFRTKLRSGTASVASQRFEAPENPRESTPVDPSRGGPGQHCSYNDHPIEEGKKAVVYEDEWVCMDCLEEIQDELAQEAEANAEVGEVVVG